MKIDADKIQFESKSEIDNINSSLNEYLENTDADNDDAQELPDLFDAMQREW